MSELWQRILIGAEQIGSVLPALVGAAVILLTGYFLARFNVGPTTLSSASTSTG